MAKNSLQKNSLLLGITIAFVLTFGLLRFEQTLKSVENITDPPKLAVLLFPGEGSSQPVQSSQEVVGKPVYIQIPKLGIEAEIEEAGEDEVGKMLPPTSIETAGWYKYGVRPGEKGKAVIDGHFDSAAGAPAIFYTLNQLNNSDEINVSDDLGNLKTFEVTKVSVYGVDEFPLSEVFGSSDQRQLNLITCAGVFSSLKNNYSHRTVVFSRLKS